MFQKVLQKRLYSSEALLCSQEEIDCLHLIQANTKHAEVCSKSFRRKQVGQQCDDFV